MHFQRFRCFLFSSLCTLAPIANGASDRPDAFVASQVLAARPDSPDPKQFGGGLTVSGDWAVIGNLPVPGSADFSVAAVYHSTANGWVFHQNLIRANPRLGDAFGNSVAIDGDTIVVGGLPPRNSSVPESISVFVRDGETWIEQASLSPGVPGTDDMFGYSLAIDGDTVVVGAYSDDTGGVSAGAAYVFVRNGTGWSEQARLVADDGAEGAEFGWSVALDGDTAIVGADNDQHDGAISAGAAYVYTRSGTVWTQRRKLIAEVTTTGGYFGISVALNADTAVVGALGGPSATGSEGKAYVFHRSADTWSLQTRIDESTTTGIVPAYPTYFGREVAIVGENVVAVSANHDRAGGIDAAGAVYVFARNAETWTKQAKLESTDPGFNYGFGSPLALSENRLFVSEPLGSLAVQLPSRVTVFDNLMLPTQTRITDVTPYFVSQGDPVVVRATVTAVAGAPAGTVTIGDGHGNNCIVDLATTDRCTLYMNYSEPPQPPYFDPYAARLTAAYAPSGPIPYLPSTGTNASVLVLYVAPPPDDIFADAFEAPDP